MRLNYCAGASAFPQRHFIAHPTHHSARSKFIGDKVARMMCVLLIGLMGCSSFVYAENFTSKKKFASKITLSKKNASLPELFKEIQKQTEYSFVYNNEMLEGSKRVTIDVKEASLNNVLSICFKDQPLTFSIVNKMVVIQKKGVINPSMNSEKSLSNEELLVTIKGKVTDEQSLPVPKASVHVRGTQKATATNNEGEFTLEEVPENGILHITSIGFESKEIPIKGNYNFNTRLKVAASNLEEAIVVAYNTTTNRANTGAVTVVKGEQIVSAPNRSFDKSLQGLVPGLQVSPGSGQPGSGTSSFLLRGIGTGGDPDMGSSVRNPLIVIDGIPVTQDPFENTTMPNAPPISNPMAQLNPSDIESISVLKDAAAIALYGSKASNGVLLITTKKGKAGRTVLNFRHQTDFSSKLKGNIEALTQTEYLELVYEAYRNSTPGITDSEIKSDLLSKFPYKVSASNDSIFYSQPNWLEDLYNNRASTISNEISLSGGNEKNNFYLNFEYTKQNGIVKNTGYDRASVRFNFETRPTSFLKFNFNNAISYNIQNFSSVNDGAPISVPVTISPLLPIRNDNGSYYLNYTWGLVNSIGDSIANPVAASEYNINRNTSYRGLSKLSAEIKVLKFLTFSSTLGIDFMLNEGKTKNDPRLATVEFNPSLKNGFINETNIRRTTVISTNILRFDHSFRRDHNLNVMIAQEAQIQNSKTTQVNKSNFITPNNEELNGAGNILVALGNNFKQTQLSYFSQLNYGFQNKYFLSGSIRTDGSSQFGKNNRFGSIYWSAGAGWILTGENFMLGTAKWLDYLKFRGSIGSSGTSAAILQSYKWDMISRTIFLDKPSITPNLGVLSPGNPNIKWEQTFSWNAGLEMRFLRNRINATLDLYVKKSTDLIDYIGAPTTTGFPRLYTNIGDIKNTGIEISISAIPVQTKNFTWQLTANWSRNQNILVKAFFPTSFTLNGIVGNEVGKNYNSFFLPKWVGVDQNSGRPLWIDSLSGKPTMDYSQAKPQYAGKPQPDGFGSVINSFSWKGIELSAMLFYQYGFQIYDNTQSLLVNDGLNPYLNQKKEALDRWQKPGDIAKNPRRLLEGIAVEPGVGVVFDQGTAYSTRYLFNGDFIRLSRVSLAYTFPKNIIQKLHLSSARIFIQGHNLAVWTNYPGLDPESSDVMGIGDFPYPLQKTYSAGLNISF